MDDKDNKQKQDFDDLQAEISGLENGRITRFLTGDDAPRQRSSNRGKAAQRAFQTQLDLLLSDPAYAAAYNHVVDLADEAQDQINGMMDRITERIGHLEETLEDMEDKTAKLPDGTAVFRDAQGRLRAADGRHLSEVEAASLLNLDSILSYDQYQATRDALNSARARQDKVIDAQRDLDDVRRKLEDPDDPPSSDDLDKLGDDIEDITKQLDKMDRANLEFNSVAAAPADKEVAELSLSMIGTAP